MVKTINVFTFFTRLGLHSYYRIILAYLGWRSKTISLFQSKILQIFAPVGILLLHSVPLLTGGNTPTAQAVIMEQQKCCLLSVYVYIKQPENFVCVR